jgi:ArsR family transcriptional regulator
MATILSRTNASSENPDGLAVQSDSSLNAEPVSPDGVTKELVRWFKLLADETRLRILFFLLEKRELNVRTLCDLLELSQPAVSHHLALLRVDGLIECRRDGKHNYYRILPDRFGELLGMIMGAVPGEQEKTRFRFGNISLVMTRADEQG